MVLVLISSSHVEILDRSVPFPRVVKPCIQLPCILLAVQVVWLPFDPDLEPGFVSHVHCHRPARRTCAQDVLVEGFLNCFVRQALVELNKLVSELGGAGHLELPLQPGFRFLPQSFRMLNGALNFLVHYQFFQS